MKRMSYKELLEAPSIVQFIHQMAICGQPIGLGTYDEAIEKHPEYFPDEVEHRCKYAMIPKEVHEKYRAEVGAMRDEVYKGAPPAPGLMGAANNTDAFKAWSEEYNKRRPIEAQREKEIHKKHYARYGI